MQLQLYFKNNIYSGSLPNGFYESDGGVGGLAGALAGALGVALGLFLAGDGDVVYGRWTWIDTDRVINNSTKPIVLYISYEL